MSALPSLDQSFPFNSSLSFLDSPRRSIRRSVLTTTFSGDMTNISQLDSSTDEVDPHEIYQQFNEAFNSKGGANQVFDMLSLYRNVLAEKTEAASKLIRGSSYSKHKRANLVNEFNSLRSEMWTWQLTESLFKDLVDTELRLTDDTEMADDDIPTAVTTDQQLMEKFFVENDKVRRCQIVVDWLETVQREDVLPTLYDKVGFFADRQGVMWENTLHAKKNARGSGKSYVRELDPDAPLRIGEKLSPLDVEDDERLVRHIFSLLRAGQFDEAQQLCVRCGQAWRAATLEGWRLAHDPNFFNNDQAVMEPIKGNCHRDVWKAACLAMVQEEAFSAQERAVYACLCGNLENLLPVCDSWMDALWAYLKVMVDVELEEHLRLHTSADKQLLPLPASYWARATSLTQLFKELEANHKDSIRDQSQHFFHKIQKHLILNDFDAVFDVMAKTRNESELSPHALRFMTHYILFLRSIDRIQFDGVAVEIIENYISYLIHSKQYSLVASYCSVLPLQNQIITYSIFLQGLTEANVRRQALEYGQKAGLDMTTITRIVVENHCEKLGDFVDFNQPLDVTLNSSSYQTNQTGSQALLDDVINSLDWLLFTDDQLLDVIQQGTAQMRILLALRLDDRLKQVYDKIPQDKVKKLVASSSELPADVQNSVKEYLCFKAYMEAKEAFNDWFKHYHQAPAKPQPPQGSNFTETVAFEQKMKQYDKDYQRWHNSLRATTVMTKEQIKSTLLFSGGWMIDEVAAESDKAPLARQCQLMRLRQICIPELCFHLQKVLHDTENYQECIQVADMVASENYCLYQAFSKSDLQTFLVNIQASSKQLLDRNKDSLGYSLS